MPRGLWAIGGLGLWWSGAWLWAQHPWGGGAGWVLACVVTTLAAWRPLAAVSALLAALPWLDWRWHTGWTAVSELQVAAAWVAAGLWGALAWRGSSGTHMVGRPAWVWWGMWTVSIALAAWQTPWHLGVSPGEWPWRGAATEPLASLWNWSLVLAIAVAMARLASGEAWRAHLSRGMACGAVSAVGLLIAERCTQLPWWELSSAYRTTAWFWEMQHGGGAIDIYLAASLPFLWHIHLRVQRSWQWWASAGLMVLATYAVVTTFSRGVLVTSVASALGMWRFTPAAFPTRQRWFNLVLGLQLATLLIAGSFAADRLSQSMVDVAGRWRHWQDMASLADTRPRQWLGIGLGQAAPQHDQRIPGGEWPGHLSWVPSTGGEQAHISLAGPASRADLAGRLDVARRWSAALGQPAALQLTWRSPKPLALRLAWCEQHLLYEGNCMVRHVDLPASTAWRTDAWAWQEQTQGPATTAGWRHDTPKVLKWSVATVGGRLDVARWAALGAEGARPIAEGDWAAGLTGWLSIARGYYVPWHIDNLWLEIKVERGWLGLAVWVAWAAWLWWGLARRGRDHCHDGLGVWWVTLCAVALNGLLVSTFEYARTGWLVQFIWVCCSLWVAESHRPGLKIPVTERDPAPHHEAPDLPHRQAPASA